MQWWAAAQNGRFTMHARQLESDKPLSQSYQRDISFIKSARGKLYDEKNPQRTRLPQSTPRF